MTRQFISIVTLLGTIVLLCSCDKKEPEPKQPASSNAPQSSQGMILDAARKAADKANQQVDAIEDSADR